jgi:hypothetical protein
VWIFFSGRSKKANMSRQVPPQNVREEREKPLHPPIPFLQLQMRLLRIKPCSVRLVRLPELTAASPTFEKTSDAQEGHHVEPSSSTNQPSLLEKP